jgi:hypothetical protein
MLRVIVRDKFSPGLNCPEDISMRRGIFPWRRNQVSWRYLKNEQKLNKKKFSQQKVRSNIIMYMRTNFFIPPQHLALYAKV